MLWDEFEYDAQLHGTNLLEKYLASCPVSDPCRSSRMAEMTRREVSAFALRVLNTSAAVTESECGRQES